jgi:hypothetical protein
MCDQGRCKDFAFGGGGEGLDLPPELFQFTWFSKAREAPSWLAPSKKIWKFEFSRPSEKAFLESFLPKISMFYYLITMKISKITTDQYDSVIYLQFNVTRKIENILEIWSLQIVSVFGHVPPGHDASERLYLVGRLLTLILRLHTALSMSYCTKSGIASYNGKNA